jgi:hypothetical protein
MLTCGLCRVRISVGFGAQETYLTLETGAAWLAASVTSMALAGVSQLLVTRVGPKLVMAIGMTLIGTGMIWATQAPVQGHFLPAIFALVRRTGPSQTVAQRAPFSGGPRQTSVSAPAPGVLRRGDHTAARAGAEETRKRRKLACVPLGEADLGPMRPRTLDQVRGESRIPISRICA